MYNCGADDSESKTTSRRNKERPEAPSLLPRQFSDSLTITRSIIPRIRESGRRDDVNSLRLIRLLSRVTSHDSPPLGSSKFLLPYYIILTKFW